jgi:hypothetical protein
MNLCRVLMAASLLAIFAIWLMSESLVCFLGSCAFFAVMRKQVYLCVSCGHLQTCLDPCESCGRSNFEKCFVVESRTQQQPFLT